MKRFIAVLMTFILVIASLPLSLTVDAAAYDPKTLQEGGATLDLRFWEDQKPDSGFYINAGNRFLLENVTAPQFGTSAGEWSVMDLLRGMYTGADYLNYIPKNYFEDYVERVNGYVIAKKGDLDRNKSTEWSRTTLSLSSLGIDIRSVGEAGNYLNVKYVTEYKGKKQIDTSNSANYYVLKLDDKDTFTTDQEYGVEFQYTNRSNKNATGFAILKPGTYKIDRENLHLLNENNEIVSADYVEEYLGKVVTTHQVNLLANTGFITLDKPYDFVEKLATSFTFSKKQGINGPIWILIAMNTGGYELYSEEELTARGVTVKAGDVNTTGKMIDHILGLEITNTTGRVGGWALSGKIADPDITMMAVQGLAPYYLDEEKFNKTGSSKTYEEFKMAVERAVLVMAADQKPNGGYASLGSINSESISQVIVALTALGIDPLQEAFYLPTIKQTVNFIEDGEIVDGAWSNNMIDAITTFWAMGSGSSSEVSGFKHVTQGYDGGGGSGIAVNPMATDQAIYGLISYDRFLKGEKPLYDMTDMIKGEYKQFAAKPYDVTYMSESQVINEGTFSPYEVLTIPAPPTKEGYTGYWSTQADGSGATYFAGERLSTPNHAITLYAQYAVPYAVSYELNNGEFVNKDAAQYIPLERKLILPTAKDVTLENHIFAGWFTNADFTGEPIATFESTEQTSVVLFAKWISYEDYVKEITAGINGLPKEENLSLSDLQAVNKVRALYELLPTELKGQITNTSKLTRIESVLQVLDVEASIDTIPTTLNLTHVDLINEINEKFNELPVILQIEVKNNKKLEAAQATISELNKELSDREAAANVRSQITALPETVDLSHLSSVKAARLAYNHLTEKQQSYLAHESSKLTNAEVALNELVSNLSIEQIKTAITELPAVEKLTLNDQQKVLAAYEMYQQLNAEVKIQIDPTPINLTVAKLIDLQINALPAQVSEKDSQTYEGINDLYISSTEEIKKLVKNYVQLTSKREELTNLPKLNRIKDATNKINAIPTSVTIQAKSTIELARFAYNSLVEDEKKLILNYSKLQLAEYSLQSAEAQDSASVAMIIAQISTLPITVTATDKYNVASINSMYQALSNNAKLQVTNSAKLLTAVATMAALEAQDRQIVQVIINAINSLPNKTSITIQHKSVIEDVRKKYEALTANQKTLVSITKLVESEIQLQQLVGTTGSLTTNGTIVEDAEKVYITVPVINSLMSATISQQLLQTTTKPTIEIKDDKGFIISVPTNALKSFNSAVHFETLYTKIGNHPAFEINFYQESSNKLKPAKFASSFTVTIPAATLLGRMAATNSSAFKTGVILGYTEDKGYQAVPHIYKNGEYIITLNEGQTLVYSDEIKSFNDIKNNSLRKEIEYLTSRYVIRGFEDDTFRPNSTITRAQFALLVSRSLGLVATKNSKFKDIKSSEDQSTIQALVETGIMIGATPTTFSPNKQITREQAAVVMVRILEYMGFESKGSIVIYTDKNKINADNLKALSLLNRLDIMTGRSDGSFGPQDTLTRAQFAKILKRTLEIVEVM